MNIRNSRVGILFGVVCRMALGIVFIYASYHKIQDPAGFAKIVHGYDLFPDVAVNLIAVLVPFIELTAGMALIMGWYPVSAVMIINGLLVCFILMVGFNLARGHEFDCGCMSSGGGFSARADAGLLIRDMFLLLMGGYLFWWLKDPSRS